MNIFVLDEDPVVAAQSLCDKHVVKMVLESAQLLCNAHWYKGCTAPYRATHMQHPCTKWVVASINNYRWLVAHALALSDEYTFRYGKQHRSASIIKMCERNEPKLENTWRRPFVQCMPDEYKQTDAVLAYRLYYTKEKAKIARWTRREPPSWWPYEEEGENERAC